MSSAHIYMNAGPLTLHSEYIWPQIDPMVSVAPSQEVLLSSEYWARCNFKKAK